MKKAIFRAVSSFAILAGAVAQADNINVQTLSPSTSSHYALTEGAVTDRPAGLETDRYRRYLLAVDYNYLHRPLVELDGSRSQRLNTVVSNLQTLDLMPGIEWNGRFSIHAALPMHLVQRTDQPNSFALGDSRLFSKFYLTQNRRPFNVALIPEVRLPTGDKGLFVSSGTVGWGALVALERDFGPVRAAANAGYRNSPGSILREVDNRQRLPLSLGLEIPVSRAWSINTEAAGSLVIPVRRFENTSEYYAGARYQASPELAVFGGGSIGSTTTASSADYRILTGLKFAPFAVAKTVPVVAEAPIVMTTAAPRVIFTPTQININEEIKFEHNSDILTPSAQNLLGEVASVIKANRQQIRLIHIEGHANILGTDEYNLKLSLARAESVKNYLGSQGIENDLLTPIGYGKRRPKAEAANLSPERQLIENRRVDFKVIQ